MAKRMLGGRLFVFGLEAKNEVLLLKTNAPDTIIKRRMILFTCL
jgi:hypothetical protein